MFDPTEAEAGADSEFVTTNEDGSKTYVLAIAAADLASVTLRRPKGADYEAQDAFKSRVQRQAAMFGRLCDIDMKVLLELDSYDFTQLDSIVTWFEKNPAPEAREAIDIVFNRDGSATVPLSMPKKSEGQDLTEITLRRLRPSDTIAVEKINGPNKVAVEMISRLGNIPRTTVRSLDAFDFTRLSDTGADFLQKRPAIGERPS